MAHWAIIFSILAVGQHGGKRTQQASSNVPELAYVLLTPKRVTDHRGKVCASTRSLEVWHVNINEKNGHSPL